ncbi:MAG: hypothetical protein RL349_1273, partial [Bacteroidota bacterium]
YLILNTLIYILKSILFNHVVASKVWCLILIFDIEIGEA